VAERRTGRPVDRHGYWYGRLPRRSGDQGVHSGLGQNPGYCADTDLRSRALPASSHQAAMPAIHNLIGTFLFISAGSQGKPISDRCLQQLSANPAPARNVPTDATQRTPEMVDLYAAQGGRRYRLKDKESALCANCN